MTRTTKRGKAERDHARDKRVGTGSFKAINNTKKLKKLKERKQHYVKELDPRV